MRPPLPLPLMKASSGAAERVFIVVIILLMKQNVVRVWKHVRTSSPHPAMYSRYKSHSGRKHIHFYLKQWYINYNTLDTNEIHRFVHKSHLCIISIILQCIMLIFLHILEKPSCQKFKITLYFLTI